MQIIEKISELRFKLAKYQGKNIGFVPTMGYLHDGHLSLVKQAKAECEVVVMSIFVNPLQFGPNEDLSRYPRDLKRDATLAELEGVDILFHPSVEEMYGKETPLVTVKVSGISDVLCGEFRPGHFDGVATVVAKLFHMVQPTHAYFGLKDAQQVAVVSQMVHDLSLPILVVPCATIRETDGLALSSRNVYLSEEERAQAVVLFQALTEAKQGLVNKRWSTPEEVNSFIYDKISTKLLAKIQYIETRTYPNLKTPTSLHNKQLLVAVAVYFGTTRLIDNILFTPKDED